MARRAGPLLMCWIALLIVAVVSGCNADRPLNPSFPLTVSDANRDINRMKSDRLPARRPVVVIGGIYDTGLMANSCRARLQEMLGDSLTISLGQLGAWSLDDYRERIIDSIEHFAPCDDPTSTVEVDVVGISLGGLAARYAALPREHGKRLRIARLFTIASPHGGATAADRLPIVDPIALDIRSGSPLHDRLDAALEGGDYPIYAYVRLGDEVVGESNTNPLGGGVWWVANMPLQRAHADAFKDPRILADIARRLRNEPPLAIEPPSPLPDAAPEHAETPPR